MNENLDLTRILEGCPEGTKLYSSIFGEVVFIRIDRENPSYPILIKVSFEPKWRNLTKQGKFYAAVGECIIFPSKEQRDWSKFERFWDKPKIKKFDINTLQPFDKVLVRDDRKDIWGACLFSHPSNNLSEGWGGWFVCDNTYWHYIIPYNDDTKHLVGTTDDCPEFYKWWKE